LPSGSLDGIPSVDRIIDAIMPGFQSHPFAKIVLRLNGKPNRNRSYQPARRSVCAYSTLDLFVDDEISFFHQLEPHFCRKKIATAATPVLSNEFIFRGPPWQSLADRNVFAVRRRRRHHRTT
jgi:hypothetical protein